MEEIRVLHLISTLVSGGVQRVILEYASNIKDYGITFDYLVQGKGNQEIEEKVINEGSRIFTIPSVNGNPFAFFKHLYSFLKEHPEYRIIHIHQNYLNWLPLLTAKIAGVKVRISHSHSNRESKSLFVLAIRKMLRFLITKSATDLWACSESAFKWLYGDNSKNKYILNNAVDHTKFCFSDEKRQVMRESLGIKDEFVCTCVGTLSEIKNQAFLLEVFNKLQKKGKFKLMLVGEGNKREELLSMINIYGLESIAHLLGERSDVDELLSASDCFVLASQTEGIPLSVIEAQFNGLPCIISDTVTDEVRITNNVCFLSIKPSDVKKWAEEIESLSCCDKRLKLSAEEIQESGYAISFEASKLNRKYRELLSR